MAQTNPLIELNKIGQSPWLDNIRRGMIKSGELARMIQDFGLRGVTSNPSIFEKAISGGTDYDEAILEFISRKEGGPAEIFESLAIQDIQAAADVFLPVFKEAEGGDGLISIEVSPRLAHDTDRTLAEAKHLAAKISRRNVMVKIPGTREGLPAIEQTISEGLSINITLLFSLERYGEVVEAYLRGLERRMKEGGAIADIVSVASFFVSRVDNKVDKLLEEKLAVAKTESEKSEIRSLMGKAAIANAKLAYEKYQEVFHGPRFKALKERGARPQRLLWASTSTKNPAYRDVIYVEELIGPDTVNTMPQATLSAFKDHGRVRLSLEEDIAGAKRTLGRLKDLGIEMGRVTAALETEGVKAFADAYDALLWCITAKREMLRVGTSKAQSMSLGNSQGVLEESIKKLEKERFVRRLWDKDPTLWKKDPEHQKIIRNALGWLDVVEAMNHQAQAITAFASEIKKEKFTHCFLLGMGGSSLAPEVIWLSIGAAPGYPKLFVLDSTDPERIGTAEKVADQGKPLFIVSSKSGSTIESSCLFKYFHEKMRKLHGERAGDCFVAITDPGTALEALARQNKFRKVFLNPADIGGRFSALSYFGLVPFALIGLDIKDFLARSLKMVEACGPSANAGDNPGLELGVTLGELARQGKNKLTFLTSPILAPFSSWVEQLLAESTGKEGQGLVPIVDERVGEPAVYGQDRVFIVLHYARSDDGELQKAVSKLESAGHPVVRITLRELADMGRGFFRWEVATAVAGSLLGINAFDQPNVQESKDRTKELLDTFKKTGQLPEEAALLEAEGLRLYGKLPASANGRSVESCLASHLSQVRTGDYVALMAYTVPSLENEAILQGLRLKIRNQLAVATTLGWGPRFLHSTGQLHKGGPNTGVFLQITADDESDLAIPGEPFSFGTLKRAQALGDFVSLQAKGRRALRVHLKAPVAKSLKTFAQALEQALQVRVAKV